MFILRDRPYTTLLRKKFFAIFYILSPWFVLSWQKPKHSPSLNTTPHSIYSSIIKRIWNGNESIAALSL